MAKYQFEVTDTFGGEANYGWVKRTIVDVPDGLPNGLVAAMAKHWAGWHDLRTTREDLGDQQVIRPHGMCQVLFVTYDEWESGERKALSDLVRWVECIGVEKNPMLAGIDLAPLECARRELML